MDEIEVQGLTIADRLYGELDELEADRQKCQEYAAMGHLGIYDQVQELNGRIEEIKEALESFEDDGEEWYEEYYYI